MAVQEPRTEIEPEQEKETGARPGKKKILIVGLAAVLLVLFCVAGALAWKFVLHKPPQAEGTQAEEHAKAPPFLYSLDPFIVNLFDPKSVRYLKLTLQLELAGITKEEMATQVPKIRDSLIILISSKKLEEVASMEGKLRLREEILFRINRILGEGKTREIYFTDFVVQ
jgi:flagellar FliL protein